MFLLVCYIRNLVCCHRLKVTHTCSSLSVGLMLWEKRWICWMALSISNWPLKRSASWLIPICLPNTLSLSKLLFLSVKIASISTVKINRKGEMGHPCLIPHEMLNLWDVPNERDIELLISLYNVLIKWINLMPKPNFPRELNMKVCSIKENIAIILNIFTII